MEKKIPEIWYKIDEFNIAIFSSSLNLIHFSDLEYLVEDKSVKGTAKETTEGRNKSCKNTEVGNNIEYRS